METGDGEARSTRAPNVIARRSRLAGGRAPVHGESNGRRLRN